MDGQLQMRILLQSMVRANIVHSKMQKIIVLVLSLLFLRTEVSVEGHIRSLNVIARHCMPLPNVPIDDRSCRERCLDIA
jgi:hypothetical protein